MDVRLTRGRMAALGAIGVAAAFAYGLWWVSGVRAVGFTGTGGGGAIGMRLLPPTDAASYDLPADAPPTYGWRRGATILYGFVFHNSLSVPVTVTGPTGDEDGQTGLLTEPRLYVPRPPLQVATTLAQVIPLHGLRIGAGQDRELVLVWHTRGTCARIASRERDTSTGEQIQAVHLRYTLLGGLVSETEWVPVAMSRPDDGSQGYLFGIEAPPIRDCPAGYPPPTP